MQAVFSPSMACKALSPHTDGLCIHTGEARCMHTTRGLYLTDRVAEASPWSGVSLKLCVTVLPCSAHPPDKEAALLHVPKQQVGFHDVEGGDEYGSVVERSCLHQGHEAIRFARHGEGDSMCNTGRQSNAPMLFPFLPAGRRPSKSGSPGGCQRPRPGGPQWWTAG